MSYSRDNIDITESIFYFQVFNMIKGDKMAFVAKKDLLIVQFGETYFKKHRREQKEYACSNRMREPSRLVTA